MRSTKTCTCKVLAGQGIPLKMHCGRLPVRLSGDDTIFDSGVSLVRKDSPLGELVLGTVGTPPNDALRISLAHAWERLELICRRGVDVELLRIPSSLGLTRRKRMIGGNARRLRNLMPRSVRDRSRHGLGCSRSGCQQQQTQHLEAGWKQRRTAHALTLHRRTLTRVGLSGNLKARAVSRLHVRCSSSRKLNKGALGRAESKRLDRAFFGAGVGGFYSSTAGD
jgi:hypothetical protein